MRPDDDLQEISIAELRGQGPSALTSRLLAPGASTKIVVADTSPLNYLTQINCDFLLPLLYRRVITPPIVLAELADAGAPRVVARWAAQPPGWLEILPPETQPDEGLCLLDAGERDAIQLAIELRASEVLSDEFKGRREAQVRGFSIVGTLGVLIAGERAGLVDAQDPFERLMQTNFRIAPRLRLDFIDTLRHSI